LMVNPELYRHRDLGRYYARIFRQVPTSCCSDSRGPHGSKIMLYPVFCALEFCLSTSSKTCEKATRVRRSLVATPSGGLPRASGAVHRCRVEKSGCGP